MADTSRLQDYPGLARWFGQRTNATAPFDRQGDALVYATCEALTRHQGDVVRVWIAAFNQFLARSDAPLADFIAAETIVQQCDAEFVDLIGELGEEAIRHDYGDPFFAAMQAGADLTGLVFLRFLAAWTALNKGDLELCVTECDKVDEPFASIYTIQGQALLELLRPKEAVEALGIAVKLCPTEAMAWFQLAKAHVVLKEHREAFAALKECLRLAPQSEEVALFMAMVANEAPDAPDLAKEAMSALKPHLPRHAGNGIVVLNLLLLALGYQSKDEAKEIIEQGDWAKVSSQKDSVSSLSQALRGLHALDWMDLASDLLGRIVPEPRRTA
jgi:tetratricopeptide (TPR) repeat protein